MMTFYLFFDMDRMLLLIGVLLFCSCISNNEKAIFGKEVNTENIDSLSQSREQVEVKHFLRIKSIDSLLSYLHQKKSIGVIKQNIKGENLSLDSLSRLFETCLIKKIIPYWYGTKWDFEGHTSIPNKGEIACGYFVSTTLKDAGVVVNRYKLAQQLPELEAKTLAFETSIQIFDNGLIDDIILKMRKELKEGVYFLGFDSSHVGFLYVCEETIFVIHSNYINAEGVVIEQIEQSEAFLAYDKFYVVPLSNNESFLKAWQKGVEIKVLID